MISRSTCATLLAACIGLICWVAFGTSVYALPHMSNLAGTPCATCHTNLQGGNARTEIGWGSMAYTGALQWSSLGLDALAEQESNQIKDMFSFGFDVRLQGGRLGAPSIRLDESGEAVGELPGITVFPMQIQPWVVAKPMDGLTLLATYSVDRGTFKNGDLCSTYYPGQACAEAMAIFAPSPVYLPTVRAGYMQPTVGIRNDDHTMYIRQDISRDRNPIIAPNYAEPGVELSMHPKYWIRGELGLFASTKLAEAVADEAYVRGADPNLAARISLLPILVDRAPTMLGASILTSGAFRMINLFAGIGWMDLGSIILEHAIFSYGDGEQNGANSSAASLVMPVYFDWLMFHARVERASAYRNGQEFKRLAAIAGFQFFPLPYIEIRPEFRFEQREAYSTGIYAVQLHLFY